VDLSRRILKFAPKCADYLEKLIDGVGDCANASHTVRSKNARHYLELAGYSPVKKSAVLTGRLTPDRIEEIKNRARAKRVAAGVAS
jgi:hypothetical protein